MIKVLFDNSVRQDGLIGEAGFQRVPEGNTTKRSYLTYETRYRPRRGDWKQGEIDKLPIIAKRIRKGDIAAFTTSELDAEMFRALKIPGQALIDIFDGCVFENLAAPLERSKWGLDIDKWLSKGDVVNYCKFFFLSPDMTRIDEFIDKMNRNPRHALSLFEIKCLKNTDSFKAICRGINEKHYPDALHLWTAEEHGMDVFLTHDQRFINAIGKNIGAVNCKVMLPSKFLQSYP